MAKKKVALAQYNHGRWIVPCPDCGFTDKGLPVTAEEASPGDEFLCGKEYPAKHATQFQEINVKKGNKTVKRHVRVADAEVRKQAWKQGRDAEKVYRIRFPKDRKEIERILRMRPVENQNWEPGETLEFLHLENIEHGIPEHKR